MVYLRSDVFDTAAGKNMLLPVSFRKMEWFSCYGKNKNLNLLNFPGFGNSGGQDDTDWSSDCTTQENFVSTKGKSPMEEEAGIKKQLNLILLGVASYPGV